MTVAGTISNRVGNGSRPNFPVAISQILSSAFSSSFTSLSIVQSTPRETFQCLLRNHNSTAIDGGRCARLLVEAMRLSSMTIVTDGDRMIDYQKMTAAELIDLLFKDEDRVTEQHIKEIISRADEADVTLRE